MEDETVNTKQFEVTAIGWVKTTLMETSEAPNQGHLGAPPAWLVFDSRVSEAIKDLDVGQYVLVLSWLDRARRDVLSCYPGSDPNGPILGVFSTRSPDRPNPIGLHRVQITAVNGLRVRVNQLELVHGTPILDVKPALDRVEEW
jgi:tRNA-Thr(GGU) m(6)t(6)A37 methyltransferase TsaA